ncbi:MAG: hypothetical protein HYY20_06175 [Candidatus Tectomicrobia bacterium]|uniref:Nitrogenase iron protein n=1 Tax=Tectimicrobiota bacterium TaxID=2528274 RepID=A0A932FV87_UNCTE|nr:hypothetical protein [Candidatus Tectomicrobia bacterium]
MTQQARQIALYGKGGIGKSTIASNLSVALADLGEKVFQIGCSPKIDSTAFLNGGEIVQPDILEQTRRKGDAKEHLMACIQRGYRGILCAETGGPEPAVGCAGYGVKLALDLLREHDLIAELGATFVIYDVIGDVVCGGFAQPMRSGYAREIYLVTSGEMLSLYSANNICGAVRAMSEEGADVQVGGIINNMRGVVQERELVEEFGRMVGAPVLAYIPRSPIVQEAEGEGGTVLEKRPDSPQAEVYRELARALLEARETVLPTPVELEEILALIRRHRAQ